MRLINDDCLVGMDKLIEEGVKVDAIITDPPYGIDFQSAWRTEKTKRFPKILNDKKPFIEFIEKIPKLISDRGSCMIFTRWDIQQQFIDSMSNNGMKPKNVIIWDKVIHGMGDLKRAYGSRYESIIYWSNQGFRFIDKRPTDIIRAQRVNANKLVHPNEKPSELLETLIKQTVPKNGAVLDLFMGSGSTGVACKNTGRNFIGIELDKTYFDIATKRINNS